MNILVAVVVGFASGVFLRSLFFESWWPVVFMVLLAAHLGAAAFVRPRLAYSLGAVFCLFVAFGMTRAALADVPPPDSFMRDLRHRVSYEGVVVADPDVRDANQRVLIRVTSDEESTTMLAVAPRHPSVAVGDKVFVSGTLALPEPFADDNGRVFRYDKYLEREGVRFMLNFAYLRVTEEAPTFSIPATLARAKHAFLDGLQTTLPEPHASLAGGIVIGGKSGLGNELKAEFVRSGLIHMVVLSGHNVMVVASWAIAFFAFVFAKVETVFGRRVPRSTSVGCGALALILFVGIAGFSATAIRAMLMALIALYARATGRTYAAGRALLFVILLMLLFNPLYLVFDPGFGLSVAATAGLIWLAPFIERWLERGARQFGRVSQVQSRLQRDETLSQIAVRPVNFWKEVVTTTLAAQAAVLPLLLYHTGNFSLVSIPANLLAMPVIPLAMGLSYLAGFAGILFGSIALTTGGSLAPLFGVALALPAYSVTTYLLSVARESASLPLAAVTLPPFPLWLTLAVYAALIYLVASPACRQAGNASPPRPN